MKACIAKLNDEQIQKIREVEEELSRKTGKKVALVAYEVKPVVR